MSMSVTVKIGDKSPKREDGKESGRAIVSQTPFRDICVPLKLELNVSSIEQASSSPAQDMR
jgi:hypothetical protein